MMDKQNGESPPRSLGGVVRRMGPGMIIAGSIVGSGELIATTKVGAEAGFYLLWLIVLGCVVKVFAQVEFGRFTITWRKTPLKALNEIPGPRGRRTNWVLWCWALMTLLIIGQQGGIVGGVGQTLAMIHPLTDYGAEYNMAQDTAMRARVERAVAEMKGESGLLVEDGDRPPPLSEPWDPYIWAGIAAMITSIMLGVGRYALIQWISTVLVALFTLITILTMCLLQMQPTWAVSPSEWAQGLSFQLPPMVEGLTRNPVFTALAAFGIIGVGASELIMYPYWCMEKGYAQWTGPRDGSPEWIARAKGWLRVLQFDAWGSMVIYTFATVAFYVLGASVLARTGLNPAKGEMIRVLAEMYNPVFGAWAPAVFLCGAFAVLYSTFFVAAAGNARMAADGLGVFGAHDGSDATRMAWTRGISCLWPLIAWGCYVAVKAPAAMVLASGVAQSIMLPIVGVAALYFRFRRLDVALRPGRLWDAMLWVSFAAFCLAGGWSLYSAVIDFFQ